VYTLREVQPLSTMLNWIFYTSWVGRSRREHYSSSYRGESLGNGVVARGKWAVYLQNLNDSLPVSPPPFFPWSPTAAALTFSCVRHVGGGQIFSPVALKFLNLRHNKIEMKLDGVKLLEGLKT
jgi:hypothetical protein